MKPGREAYLRRVSAPSGPWVQLTGAMLREVFDEVDALRAAISATVVPRGLPVIATCGDCMHADGMTTTTCHYVEDAPRLAGLSTSPPPSWCPLRGAQ